MRPEPISSGLHQRTKTKVIIDKPSSLDSAEDPPEPGTMEPRKAQVHDQELDWAFLRSRGLLPGGFGVERAEIWYAYVRCDGGAAQTIKYATHLGLSY